MKEPRVTPSVLYQGPSQGWSAIWLKDETQQNTGAFKYRGNHHLVSSLASCRGVITASTGNHGAGLAEAALYRAIPAIVIVPQATTEAKTDRIKKSGAKVVKWGGGYDECEQMARKLATEEGLTYVSSFDDSRINMGHRSLCQEVDSQVGSIHKTFVPIGGGGLIAACLGHWSDGEKMVGVEYSDAPAMFRSLEAGYRIRLASAEGPPEGLLVRQVGALAFRICMTMKPRVDLVSLEEIEEAIRLVYRHNGIRAEHAGAAPLAAALASPVAGAQCLCIVSGGNIHDTRMNAILRGG